MFLAVPSDTKKNLETYFWWVHPTRKNLQKCFRQVHPSRFRFVFEKMIELYETIREHFEKHRGKLEKNSRKNRKQF